MFPILPGCILPKRSVNVDGPTLRQRSTGETFSNDRCSSDGDRRHRFDRLFRRWRPEGQHQGPRQGGGRRSGSKRQGSGHLPKAGGELQIGIGQPGSSGAVAVQATDANPPVVHQIALGTVNGVNLAYQQGSPGASAQATKDGDGYKFTGTATGVDPSNPMAGMVSKPFEVDVTCP